jgi:hypothetical protein
LFVLQWLSAAWRAPLGSTATSRDYVENERQNAATSVAYEQARRVLDYIGIIASYSLMWALLQTPALLYFTGPK